MATTLTAVLILQPARRDADAGTLVRSLYEHAVHFAWLAADPSPARLGEWRKQDLVERIKAHNDLAARGFPVLEEENLAAFTAEIAALDGHQLVLADLATAADLYWGGQIPGMATGDRVVSFRGWYGLVYRHYSAVAHPTIRGLHRVVDDVGGVKRRVVIERADQGDGPYGMGVLIFAVALFVASQSLDWPSKDEITEVFDRHKV